MRIIFLNLLGLLFSTSALPQGDIPTITTPPMPTTPKTQTESSPIFEWASDKFDRSYDTVPDLNVRFSDGSVDHIVLDHYNAIDDEFFCTFLGKLESESQSSVAVTGCPGDTNYKVTITSEIHDDATYNVDHQGYSVKTRNISPDEIRFIDPNNDDNEFISQLKAQYNSMDKVEDRQSGDEYYLRLAMGYGQSFLDELGSKKEVKKYLGRVMTHLQAYYRAPSLTVKINFDKPFPLLDMTDTVKVTYASGQTLDTIKPYTKQILIDAGNAQHLAVWVNDKVTGDFVGGYAYLGAICLSSMEQNKVSINEYRKNEAQAAKIMAHELGHNFGMQHDDGNNCVGIMNATVGLTTWSQCSVNYFNLHKQTAESEDGFFCLKRDDPMNIQASWAPWGRFTLCSKNCGGGTKERDRICIGSKKCPGSNVDIVGCNEHKCSPCVDNPNPIHQCKAKAAVGWCGAPDEMKGKCDASCHVDRASVGQCKDYKADGYCPISHVNGPWMAQNCAKTCGTYCS